METWESRKIDSIDYSRAPFDGSSYRMDFGGSPEMGAFCLIRYPVCVINITAKKPRPTINVTESAVSPM